MRFVRWVAIAVVLAASGCGTEAPIDHGTFSVSLGGTDDQGEGFVPLAGDRRLVPGAQGGFHLWVKYRVCGVPGDAVKMKRTARRIADGRAVLAAPEQTERLPDADAQGCRESLVPVPWFMCPTPIGVGVKDQTLRFNLDVSDMDGTTLGAATADVTLRCPDGPQANFCNSICAG